VRTPRNGIEVLGVHRDLRCAPSWGSKTTLSASLPAWNTWRTSGPTWIRPLIDAEAYHNETSNGDGLLWSIVQMPRAAIGHNTFVSRAKRPCGLRREEYHPKKVSADMTASETSPGHHGGAVRRR
jgi:hypothetical protein